MAVARAPGAWSTAAVARSAVQSASAVTGRGSTVPLGAHGRWGCGRGVLAAEKGFDDLPEARWLVPELATVHQRGA
jgi:hypothetical protein